MILLDTCALLWQSFDQEALSPRAKQSINHETKLIISSISVWEVGIKIKNKKLSIPMKFEKYVQNLQDITELEIIPVDENIWMESLNLKWNHTDPADRVIVSTAMSLGLDIVTTDKKMKSFYKKVIWN